MTTPKTDALMARWDDDGATRGAAFCELRDLARELEASLADANAHRQNLLTASKDWGRERDTLNQCLLQSQNAAIYLAQKNEELLTVLQRVQTKLDPHRDAVAWGIVVNAFLQYGPGPDATPSRVAADGKQEQPVTWSIGGRYNWKGQQKRLVYLGRNWSGNGYWHQFEKVGNPGAVWCEVLDDQLAHFEETRPAD